jgi:AraC-like DNA-binding protein
MPLYGEQPPSASHARWVECGWFLQSATAVQAHRVPPDGCIDIIYDRRRGLRAVGAMTREQRFHLPENVCVAGIRFRPGKAGPFLRTSLSELTDSSVALEDLWSHRAREWRRRLDDAKSIQDAMRILLGNLPVPAAQPNPVQRAIEAMAAVNGNTDLDRVAGQANLNPRQFRRRCLQESGLAPKRLCRVLRFRHVCRVAGALDPPNWSAIAVEAGYFDQSHLIRDFGDFTGLTPMSVFSNTRARDLG